MEFRIRVTLWFASLLIACDSACTPPSPLPTAFKVKRDYWSFFAYYEVEVDGTTLAEVEATDDKMVLELTNASGAFYASFEQEESAGAHFLVKDCEGNMLAVIDREGDDLGAHTLKVLDPAGEKVLGVTSADEGHTWIPFKTQAITVTLGQSSQTETSVTFALLHQHHQLFGNGDWNVEIVYPGYNTTDPSMIISTYTALDPRLLAQTAPQTETESEPLLTQAAQDKEAAKAIPLCFRCCVRGAGPPMDGPPPPQ